MKQETPEKIEAFNGEYRFLSNFWEAPVTFNGITYQNAEACYQCQKAPGFENLFVDATPQEAKKLGRKIPVRPDWESVKRDIMLAIVRAKFTQNADLANKLRETGNALLIEGNWWGDTYWGVCRGKGQNELGKILMQVRAELHTNPNH